MEGRLINYLVDCITSGRERDQAYAAVLLARLLTHVSPRAAQHNIFSQLEPALPGPRRTELSWKFTAAMWAFSAAIVMHSYFVQACLAHPASSTCLPCFRCAAASSAVGIVRALGTEGAPHSAGCACVDDGKGSCWATGRRSPACWAC